MKLLSPRNYAVSLKRWQLLSPHNPPILLTYHYCSTKIQKFIICQKMQLLLPKNYVVSLKNGNYYLLKFRQLAITPVRKFKIIPFAKKDAITIS